MEQRRLGQARLAVPVIGAGTWRVFDVSEDAAAGPNQVVEEVLAAGGRHRDNLEVGLPPWFDKEQRELVEQLVAR